MNPLRELLLYDLSSKITPLEGKLSSFGYELIPAFLFFGILLSFLTDLDFGGVVKRTVLALIAMGIYKTIFISSVNLGFDVGSELLSKNNFIHKDFENARSTVSRGFNLDFEETVKPQKEKSIWTWDWGMDFLPSKKTISDIGTLFSNDILGFLMWLLSNLSLWFVRITFTLIYYLLPLTIPIVALVNILPISKKALEGSLLSIVWVGATPIVIALMLEVLDGVLLHEDIIKNASLLSRGAMGIIFSIYLISSFAISLKLVGSGTIGEAVNQASMAYGMGVTNNALDFVRKKSSMLVGRGMRVAPRAGFNKAKQMSIGTIEGYSNLSENLSRATSEIKGSKGITADQILNGNRPKLTPKEKMISLSSAAISPFQTLRQRRNEVKTAAKLVSEGRGDQVLSESVIKHENTKDPIDTLQKDNRGRVTRPQISKSGEVYVPSSNFRKELTARYAETPPEPEKKLKSIFSTKPENGGEKSELPPVKNTKFSKNKNFKNSTGGKNEWRRTT